MSTIARTLATYVELARLSNAPTCITNVLVGCAIGLVSTSTEINILSVVLTMVAVLLLYSAGMALNDLVDQHIDAVERPKRPLPSGRASRRGVFNFVASLMIGGITLLAFVSWLAMVLGVVLCMCVIAYDLLHKANGWTIVLMGLCRGLVYLLGAASIATAINWQLAGAFAVAITLYIIVLTLVARKEATVSIGSRRWLAMALPLIVLVPVLVVPGSSTLWMALAGLCVLVWTVRGIAALFQEPPRIKAAVLTWLAGICLVDAFYLCMLDQPQWAMIAAGCFFVTVIGHRVILGT